MASGCQLAGRGSAAAADLGVGRHGLAHVATNPYFIRQRVKHPPYRIVVRIHPVIQDGMA